MTITVEDWLESTAQAQRILLAARGRRLHDLGARNHAEGMRLVKTDATAALFHHAAQRMGRDLEALDYTFLSLPIAAVFARAIRPSAEERIQ